MAQQPSFMCSLAAGGVAGTMVDVSLFPLDTIKTRRQAPQGFCRAGGLAGIYRGLGPAALGSFPTAALFFATYESANCFFGAGTPLTHMCSAVTAEGVACLVRVPTENVKQKLQAGIYKRGMECARAILAAEGARGFFAGYMTTVMRGVPFSALQFTIFESLKRAWFDRSGVPVAPLQAALCGSVAGATAGLVTTPLDVTKTRQMLGTDGSGVQYNGMVATIRRIYADEGLTAFASGLAPRVSWIAMGGAVFLGSYEYAKQSLAEVL